MVNVMRVWLKFLSLSLIPVVNQQGLKRSSRGVFQKGKDLVTFFCLFVFCTECIVTLSLLYCMLYCFCMTLVLLHVAAHP